MINKDSSTQFEIEWQRMLAGEIYNAVHPLFGQKMTETQITLWEYNNLHPDQTERRRQIISTLLGKVGNNVNINQPFRCDFGCNITIGDNFYGNFNLTILDEGKVTIGNNVFVGPNVSILTPCHPLEPQQRNTGQQWAMPVNIGDNVWIGGDVTILPGVTIGCNTVIGAGSVVTKNIPDNVVAAGNPAKIIKSIIDQPVTP